MVAGGRDRLAVDHRRIGPAELPRHLLAAPSASPARLSSRLKSVSGSLWNGDRRRGCGPSARDPRADPSPSPALFERIHEQLLLGHVFGEAGPQERFVGRVLQQPPHQVGHAGQQLAVGRVDAHALAQRHQRVLDRLGHAVEHLQLVAASAAGRAARPAARAWARLRTLWLPKAGRSTARFSSRKRVSRS